MHLPVMLREVLEFLAPLPGNVVVDATAGYGGHAVAIAEVLGSDGFLLGLDQDPDAVQAARERLAGTGVAHHVAHAPFSRIAEVLSELGLRPPDAILWDLGVSSPQLDRPERGLSFLRAGPLDMRMNPQDESTAADLVNRLPQAELQEIFSRYGEERFSGRIARRIVERRDQRSFSDTADLAEVVAAAVPGGRRQRIHPATRVFQALRIAVNRELAELEAGLPAGIAALAENGRAVVLAYHSLEDRIVKGVFRDASRPDAMPRLAVLTKKPVRPSEAEASENPRARSARLRAARRIQRIVATG